ncbi:MAG: IS701 family transposase [Salinisphaera sp.]|nr:IS701 family transposase [Salinisphaera sp.]
MGPTDLDEWSNELAGLVARIAPQFYRQESKRHAEQYLRGLLAPLARKNGWTIADYIGEPEPKALQRFLNLSPWDPAELMAINRTYAMENLADPGGILVADPTGFAKKGTKSVGVQRQYSGTLGRIDRCQIATFLAYVTAQRDRVLIDCRLYMPEKSWIDNPERCVEAGVPPEVTFKTRPQQVREMIEAARAAEVPFAWFVADEEFGQNPGLCDYLETERLPYLMGIPKNTTFRDTNGDTHQIEKYTQRLSPTAWQRRACGIGSKGYRVYDWALVTSAEADRQYLIRRSLDDGELAYYRCYNPNRAGFGELVQTAGARWPIEECFAASKNETGLDNYQVRTWPAWHRHIALAMLAHTFLAITAQHARKSGRHTVSASRTRQPRNPADPSPPDPTHPR